jgi:hypothetical protein
MIVDLMGFMQVESLGEEREKENVTIRIISDHGKKFEDVKSESINVVIDD